MKLLLALTSAYFLMTNASAAEPRTFSCSARPPTLPKGATLVVTLVDNDDGTGKLTYSYSHPFAHGELRESFPVQRRTFHMGERYSGEGVSFFVSNFGADEGETGRFTRVFDTGSRLDLTVNCGSSFIDPKDLGLPRK